MVDTSSFPPIDKALTGAAHKRQALAERVLQMARDEGWDSGQRLTEQHLAERLEVSRSPIRAALKHLAEQGAVVLEPGRGARFNLTADALSQMSLATAPPAGERLYEAVIRSRLSGQLGESFTQAEVMRLLGASRARVEPVLHRLASDGLVAKRKGQGWAFHPTLDSERAHRESYEFRKLLEPGAIRSPLFHMAPERLRALQDAHHDLIRAVSEHTADAAYIYSVDIAFHRSIAQCSGNAFIEDALERQNKLRRLLEYTSYDRPERVIGWAREHLDILAALERQRIEVAATLMLEHIGNAERETPSPR